MINRGERGKGYKCREEEVEGERIKKEKKQRNEKEIEVNKGIREFLHEVTEYEGRIYGLTNR